MNKVYDPFSYEIDEDPYPVYRWMRDEAPVYRNEALDFYALTRFHDNLDAFIDKDAYTSTWSTSLEFMKEPHPDSGPDDLDGSARAQPLPRARVEGVHAAADRRSRAADPRDRDGLSRRARSAARASTW
jgi:hypothetical protein